MPARRRKPASLIRLGLAPPLTRREVRELRARAAADLRSISNYVSHLVVESLKGKRIGPTADPREKRTAYSISLYLTAQERRRLEARAKAERRSLSGHVGRKIAAEQAQR